jgi:hypothetical protein
LTPVPTDTIVRSTGLVSELELNDRECDGSSKEQIARQQGPDKHADMAQNLGYLNTVVDPWGPEVVSVMVVNIPPCGSVKVMVAG